jgi:hypothetical protein
MAPILCGPPATAITTPRLQIEDMVRIKYSFREAAGRF